jgi:hypothetical protein
MSGVNFLAIIVDTGVVIDLHSTHLPRRIFISDSLLPANHLSVILGACSFCLLGESQLKILMRPYFAAASSAGTYIGKLV